VIRELLNQPPADLGQLREVLETRLVCCVITKEEDRAVTKADYGIALVPGAGYDPGARYRAAGIDTDGFAPLQLCGPVPWRRELLGTQPDQARCGWQPSLWSGPGGGPCELRRQRSTV
jgi:hypothetical protein